MRPLAEALEQLRLADAAAAIEHEQLRPARLRQLLEDRHLPLPPNELLLVHGWEYTDSYYTNKYIARGSRAAPGAPRPFRVDYSASAPRLEG